MRLVCLVVLPASLGFATIGSAQAPNRSALLGADLPAVATRDNGFMARAAGRATLGLMASDAAVRLGDEVEVFRLPVADTLGSARAVFTGLRDQGFALAFAKADSALAVVTKSGARHLVYHARDRRTQWLYVGVVTADDGASRAVGTSPTPAPQAPASGRSALASGTPAPASAPAAPTVTGPAAAPSGPVRYQLTSTTFGDGWESTEQADHVRAVQGPLTIWLMHRIPITEQMRPPVTSLTDFLWTKDVASRFTVLSTDDRDDVTRYSGLTYREGAVRTAEGRQAYVAMFASVESGTAVNIIALAPDAATLRQRFPRPESLETALSLNRFGITASDLPGTWTSSDGAYMPMYYVASGMFAGMAGASLADEFVFLADGTYRSKHSGASTSPGRGQVFTQRYAGTWRLEGSWKVVLTERYGGTTESFDAMFSSVTGGRILHLVRQPQSGVRYNLGRRP